VSACATDPFNGQSTYSVNPGGWRQTAHALAFIGNLALTITALAGAPELIISLGAPEAATATTAEDAGVRAAGKALEPMWAQAPNNGFLGGWSTTETLQPGTVIDRYGAETGRFFSPGGTPLEARSLPTGAGPLNTYQVLKSFNVQGGIAASAFGQAGGGVQYIASQTVSDLIEGGFIKPVVP
jgi:hypothetical protein